MKEQRTDKDGATFSQALKLMNPSGTLVPGTNEYDSIKDMIIGWIDECGSECALDMAKMGAVHLDMWLKCR